jgi:hypothetical protein
VDRRQFIRHLGIGICAGAAVPFIPSLIPDLIGDPLRGATTDFAVGASADLFAFDDLVKITYSDHVVMDLIHDVWRVKSVNVATGTVSLEGLG